MVAGVKIDPRAKQTEGQSQQNDKGRARAKVAQKTGVSEAKVKRAQAVKNKNAELADAVKQGAMTLAQAEKKVKEQERNEKRAELAQAGAMVKPQDRWNVWQADI